MTQNDTPQATRPPSPWPLLAGLLVIALASLALWRWGAPVTNFFRDQERVRAWLASFGPLAPLLSILLNVAQVLLAMIPGQVIALANGYLFGVFWGTVYSLVGVSLGSVLAMGLGRWLGRSLVLRLVEPARLARWDALLLQRGPRFFFLVFLLPLLPDDITCFIVGLSPLSIPYILALATIGRLPGLIAGSWIGANAGNLSPAGWALVGGGALGLAWTVLRYQDQIEAAMLRLLQRRDD
ncbi:MAG: TVP38/TMEM64 family protein [Anaerolineae bacterium]|jgi:uncharacterized membrane protein YdjX (TVP38/TMEM64 family)